MRPNTAAISLVLLLSSASACSAAATTGETVGDDAGFEAGDDGGSEAAGDDADMGLPEADALDGGDDADTSGGDAETAVDDTGDADALDGDEVDAPDGDDAGGDADASDAGDAGADGEAGTWPASCTVCHGTPGVNPAPPLDLSSNVDTTQPGVGAHQKHLADSDWHRVVQCSDCHIVPSKAKDPAVPTHQNGVDDVIWGPVAKRGTFDTTAHTCTNVWCHGGPPQPDLAGTSPATVRAPLWTKVDGTQALCGQACHTTPPGGGHPPYTKCEGCHADVVAKFTPGTGGAPPTVVWADKNRHVDGIIDYDGMSCTTCHGDAARGATGDPAPPRGVRGETLTTDPAVGAHQSHLGRYDWHRDVQCTDCHAVPTDVMHTNGVVDFAWSGPSNANGASPAYDLTKISCAGTWCHGTKLSGGTITTPVWNQVDGTQKACGSCHGLPPTTGHPANQQCETCHSPVIKSCPPGDPAHCVFQPDVGPTQSYKLHVDGKVDLVAGGKCDGCHGAPPPNGTHLAHAGGADLPTAYGSLEPRTNATSYAFNCGYCHPLDGAKHMDGKLEVELYDASAPGIPTDPMAPGDRKMLKGASPTAAYVPGATTFTGSVASYTNGTCTNVYCHSAEMPQVASVPFPTTNVSPASFQWQSVTPFYDVSTNQCCLSTPDDYPDFSIAVTRSFATPKWVGETHAGPDKCAHCHAYPPRAEPPGNVGAGQGHAWMDQGWEDGHFFNMAKGWPIQCRRCHSTTVANYLPDTGYHYDPATDRITFDQAMTILDYTTHLNGRKDVTFDLSPSTCSSSAPDLRYSTVPCLKTATFDPTTRTCSNVECHLSQKKATWGAPYRFSAGSECNACHTY